MQCNIFSGRSLLKNETKNEKILRWSLQGGRRPYIRAVLKTGESLESLLRNRSWMETRITNVSNNFLQYLYFYTKIISNNIKKSIQIISQHLFVDVVDHRPIKDIPCDLVHVIYLKCINFFIKSSHDPQSYTSSWSSWWGSSPRSSSASRSL